MEIPSPNNRKSAGSRASHGKNRQKGYKTHRKHKKDEMKLIARERVEILFDRALRTYKEDPVLANHYIEIAKRIRMVVRLRLPTRWRPYICRGCKQLLLPGINCQVRVQSRGGRGSHIAKTCRTCGHVTRFYLKKQINTGNGGN
ncbi:MAG TPA: ribonuclease P [Candidatus Lokiarchaeia archaeon]|nr:ribonuclease P [Candidatus Lokiarchaeia archaeon]